MQRSEEELEGHSVLMPTQNRNRKNWVGLTSLRLQVKDLKSVCLCTRAKIRMLQERGGDQQIKSAGLS